MPVWKKNFFSNGCAVSSICAKVFNVEQKKILYHIFYMKLLISKKMAAF